MDGYDWLHGASLVTHEGTWFVTWGNNQGSENTPTEVVRGRRSYDDFATLTDVEMIAPGTATEAVSHGTLLSLDGTLWGFFGRFEGVRQNVRTEAYVLNEQTDEWESQGIAIEGGFWPMDEPTLMDDGNYIMGGLKVGGGNPPAVAISHGTDLTRWDMITLPLGDGVSIWGESTVIVDGSNILNIARGSDPWAYASMSTDYGETWTPVERTNMPMAASKPYAGTLSDGRNYLICTNTADSGNTRRPLTISLTDPGGGTYNQVYRIRDGVRVGEGTTTEAALAYPYAVEEDGNLYVVYSVGRDGGNRNSCELAVIPLWSLGGDQPPGPPGGELLAYEGFEYPTTNTIHRHPFADESGGSGWGDLWRNADSTLGIPEDEASLNYPEGVEFESAGARVFNRPGDSEGTRSFEDFVVSFDSEGTYYLSFLATKTDSGHTGDDWMFVQLIDGATRTARASVGFGNDEALLLGSDASAGETVAGGEGFSDETVYFAMKLVTHNGGGDEFYLKAYREGGIVEDEPTTWDLVYQTAVAGFADTLRVSTGEYALGAIDEIRVGTGWEAVITGRMPMEGDLNGDGYVGSADLDLVRANWGQKSIEGDANGDGRVDSQDLDLVRAHWGEGTPVSVPEPDGILLIVAVLFAALWNRRSHQ